MMEGIKTTLVGLIIVNLGGYVGCQGPGAVRLTPNVALRGVATQSETHANTDFAASPFIASYANDGNFDTSMTTTRGACSLTETTSPVWWQVDLLEVYEITKVAITGRDAYPSWLEGFYIDVSNNSAGSSAQQCAHEPKPFVPSETRVYMCPCGMFGRYVRIRYHSNRSNRLQLCEVQVQAGGLCPEPEEMDSAVRSVPNTQYEVGTNVMYTCGQCYAGGGTSTCQCNREWTPVPKCTIEHCNDPGSIENGQKVGSGPFTCISTVQYTCNQRYWLLGAEILRCGIDGQWNHAKPSCIDKNLECGEPPKITNSLIFGSITDVTYQCDECFMQGGSATCRNGQWTQDGSCEVMPCNVPDVPNARRSPPESSVTCGTEVTYTCYEGPILEGDSVLQCGTGGQLKGQLPVCKTSSGDDTTQNINEIDNDKETEKVNDVDKTRDMNENNNEKETEKVNDPLALVLTAVVTMVVSVLITLAALYLCIRRGIDPCTRAVPSAGNSETVQDYQQPNSPPEIARANQETNDQYAELNTPQFAGYKNQLQK